MEQTQLEIRGELLKCSSNVLGKQLQRELEGKMDTAVPFAGFLRILSSCQKRDV